MQAATLHLQQDLSEARSHSARLQQQLQQQAQLVDAVETECTELRGALAAARVSFAEQRAFGAAPGPSLRLAFAGMHHGKHHSARQGDCSRQT